MRIAVVSNNGEVVDVHFAEAEQIFIYELNGSAPDLVEQRSIPTNLFNGDRLSMMKSMVKDCKQLYMTDVEDQSADDLIEAGIEPVIYDGPIVAIRHF
jgi:hypothetical protein